MHTADIVVIGGGIAGVSVAAALTASGLGVALVEMEPTLAFHTTGRSAAQYLKNYGNDVVRRLTIASAEYFSDSPDGTKLWAPRPLLQVAATEQAASLRAEVASSLALAPATQFLDGDESRSLVPVLSPEVAGSLYEPDAMELDVAAIHHSFVGELRAGGGTVQLANPVVALSYTSNWIVTLADGSTIETPVVVNAAGAWGDQVASLAGIDPVPLHPRRRTVAVASVPDEIDPSSWPLIAFLDREGTMEAYCKAEPGGLLVSPADESPSQPCDARPEEVDVARGIDTLNRWTTLAVRHVTTTWAGLRTFAADRSPVAGYGAGAPGFFWFVGQGGYGIQMAPGLARVAAALVVDGAIPGDLADVGLSAADLSPTRAGLGGPLVADH